MGKSSSSCLKIIACGSDTADNDDIEAPETKASGDKRGWSFRKRSGRHRVLGNNVSSENPTFADKEIAQSATSDFQVPIKYTSADEKPQRSVEKITEAIITKENGSESKTSAVVFTSENGGSAINEESKICHSVVALDDDINTTSAESKTSNAMVVSENDCNTKLTASGMADVMVSDVDSTTMSAESKTSDSVVASENSGDAGVIVDESVVIIIQTAIRGFLARRAFVQSKSAIKLQAAIRGYLVRRNAVETLYCIRAIVKVQALIRARSSKFSDQKSKSNDAQIFTLKLLKNSFARQLLESTPRPKSVNIRCDSVRPNSAWGWLERWMSVSTSEDAKKLEPNVEQEDDNQVQKSASKEEAEYSSMVVDLVKSEFSMNQVAKSLEKEENHIIENEENHIIHDANTVDSQSCYPLSTEVMIEESHPQKTEIIHEDVDSIKTDVLSNENSLSQLVPTSLADDPTSEIEEPKLSTKDLSSEVLNGERITSSYQEVGAESHGDIALSLEDSVMKTNEPSVLEGSGPSDPRIHIAHSECGTELSVSSTLDSPDRYDFGHKEAKQEIKSLEETSRDPESTDGPDFEANGMSSHCVTDLPSDPIQQEEVHQINGASVNPVIAEMSPQVGHKLEVEEPGSGTEHQTYKSSPDSPKSHMTVPESQGTPSSQVSVKGKRKKTDKNGSNTKHSPLSVGKRSPSNPSLESGARSSSEQLAKDHKSGKRRNSFGSTKSDNADQEPRDSSSRNSLPSYMQATESAKAKANSPRSSPDVHDKEVYSKKRHSLPGANGKQGSPRIQQSTSPASQGPKANGSQSSNERKWQR